jgi:hypothetical protein
MKLDTEDPITMWYFAAMIFTMNLIAMSGFIILEYTHLHVQGGILLTNFGLLLMVIGLLGHHKKEHDEFEEDTQSPGTEGKEKMTEVEEGEHLRALAIPQETEKELVKR